MLRSLPIKRENSLQVRLIGIAIFVVLTAISAKISIPLEPIPFTLQVLVVLLSGMVLGSRDGSLSQLTYVMMIALGLPIDAKGIGSAALFSPTGGFLLGFIVAAGVTGLMVEYAGTRLWQRWIAGLVGVIVIYFFGASHLMLYTGMDLNKAYTVGVQPFIVLDMIKALLAAGLVETARRFIK